MGAIEVLEAEGWRGAARDAVKQTAELEGAQRQVRCAADEYCTQQLRIGCLEYRTEGVEHSLALGELQCLACKTLLWSFAGVRRLCEPMQCGTIASV